MLPPAHTQSSALIHTCSHTNTLSKHTHTCPDNSCYSVAHSHRQTMPSSPFTVHPSPPVTSLLLPPALLLSLSSLLWELRWRNSFLVNATDGIVRPDGDNVFQRLSWTPTVPSQEQFSHWGQIVPVPYNGVAALFPPVLLMLRLLLYRAAWQQSAPFTFPRLIFSLSLSPFSSNKAPPLGPTVAQKLHAASSWKMGWGAKKRRVF